MSRYIYKRLLLMIPVVIMVAVLIFTIMYFTPGDPAIIILGPNASLEQLPSGQSWGSTSHIWYSCGII